MADVKKKEDSFLRELREKVATTKCITTRNSIKAIADAYDAALNPPKKDEATPTKQE